MLRDHTQNKEIRDRTGVKDIITEYPDTKLKWAGHVTRFADNWWTHAIVKQYPSEILSFVSVAEIIFLVC